MNKIYEFKLKIKYAKKGEFRAMYFMDTPQLRGGELSNSKNLKTKQFPNIDS